ncbi:MAG: flagellar hook-associated protein FlgL [candidate division Zixibacteria bacterium]
MRVTNQMIINRTIFNLSRNASRFMDLQSMLSTGRRINTPSDDPIGTQRDLNYRSRLAEIIQLKSNVSQAYGRLSFYEDTLNDLKNLYESSNLTATTMANDTFTAVEREAAANEVDSIYQQVLQLANKKINGRYIYSGHRIRTAPLEASTHGVVYNGDTGILESEIEASERLITNLNGQETFFAPLLTLGENGDLSVGITNITNLADLNLGSGIDQTPGTFEIHDANRDLTYVIDVSGETTVGDLITNINTSMGVGGNLTLDISGSGNALEWKPEIGTINTVTDMTPLSNLREGNGITKDPGLFRIRNATSTIDFTVDISSATNLGEVRNAITTALTGAGISNVSIGYNANGTGLAITDANAVPLDLIIEDLTEEQSTAYELGIAGNVGANLEGADLRPQPDFTIRDIGGQTTATDLGSLGGIRHNFIGQDIRPRLTSDSTLASLNNLTGFGLGEIHIAQGSRTVVPNLGNSSLTTIDDLISAINSSGLDVQASINASETGIQVVSTIVNESLTVKSNDSSRTAEALGIAGSPDMLGSLILLSDALHNNDREMAGALMNNLDLAMRELLRSRADVGSRMMRLDTTRNRLESTETSVTKMLSEVEDADIITLISDVAREENLYQAALVASSKVIQPSLIDFLQ